MDHARIGGGVRVQMQVFSGKVSAGLPKVAQRLVREVLYGMQARGSVRLSEIARSLGEATGMKKLIERLGRGLGRRGLRHQIRQNLLSLAAPRITADTLLVIDPSDLTKPYAKKMEYLARVRDGSKKQLADGYWCLEVVAARRATAEVVPLYQELYSQRAPDFVSENQEILKAIDTVSMATGGRGVWVMDGEGDRERILGPLLKSGRPFLVRQRGDRHLLWRRQRREVVEIAAQCRRRYRQTIIKQEAEKEKRLTRCVSGPPRCAGQVRIAA